MKQFELEEMTKAQLVTHGLENDVEVDPLLKKGDMIELLLKGSVPDAKPADLPLPKQDTLRTLDGEKVNDEMLKLTIHATESRTADVDVTINGHRYHIKRDVEVMVPASVVSTLKDAVVNTYTQDPETGKQQAVRITHYPFSAVPCQ